MQKKCKKICSYQKKVVPLHPLSFEEHIFMPFPAEANKRQSVFEALLGRGRFSRLTGDRFGCHSSVGRAKD